LRYVPKITAVFSSTLKATVTSEFNPWRFQSLSTCEQQLITVNSGSKFSICFSEDGRINILVTISAPGIECSRFLGKMGCFDNEDGKARQGSRDLERRLA
jgi:hypothetical protein